MSSQSGATKVVILARGLGTRMKKADPKASIDSSQSAAADAGVKGMIPVGRPFLDFLLSALADAGFRQVCLVIGPEHTHVRDHYGSRNRPQRIDLAFAIQQEPLGTADAVLAAESFADGEAFAVTNSDNYYPIAALEQLRLAPAPAIVAFDRDTLISSGNVEPERAGRFGALDIDEEGRLLRILARPDAAMTARGGQVYASMNCWLFTSEIFDACRAVPMSARGERELPQAVQIAIDRGAHFHAVRVAAPVLDLSSRADIAGVASRLSGVKVAL